MEIAIDKSKIMLETCGSCELSSVSKSGMKTSLHQISFEGITGFNEKYIKPLMELMASHHPFYKCIRVNGDMEKTGSSSNVMFFNIVNIRQTTFLFSTLKTLGINLNELRIGYNENKPQLFLNQRIIRLLSSINEETRIQLAVFLYCIAKFLYSITKTTAKFKMDNSVTPAVVSIDADTLSDIYTCYQSLDTDLVIDFQSINDDSVFRSVTYHVIPTSKPAESSMKTSTLCKYTYNCIVDADKVMSLLIINESYAPKAVYRILGNEIFTNIELQAFNTFDFGEYIPTLVCNLLKIDKKDCCTYTVHHASIERILSSSTKEVTITNEVTDPRFYELLESYPEISENCNMKFYEGYFVGVTVNTLKDTSSLKEYYDKDEYAQQLYKQIQPYYESFDLKDLTGVVKGVAKGEVFSMLFEGEAGTGKSTAARVILTRCGIPFTALNCSTNIEESDIFGTMIPNPEKKSADDPEFIWKDGPATKAIRNGYGLIVEELGGARPGILMKFNSLMDESRQIDLPNGEVLKAHPNFRFIATTNIAYEGTNRLNKALVDRFEICKKFKDLNQREATAIIKARTGYTDDDKINKVFSVYNAVKKYSNEQNLGLVISIRCLLNIFKMGKYYKTAKEALDSLMLNQAFLEEPEHLKYFTDTVLNAFELSFKL